MDMEGEFQYGHGWRGNLNMDRDGGGISIWTRMEGEFQYGQGWGGEFEYGQGWRVN